MPKGGTMVIDFTRSFFGYHKEDVDQYFRDREKDIQTLLQSKYVQLEDMKETNQQHKTKVKEALQKEQDLLNKREQIFNAFVQQLALIEDTLQQNQDDMRKAKLNDLNRLKQKVEELENWKKQLTRFNEEIIKIRDQFRSQTALQEQ
jgi:cell division septum initiation protein DivIVA